ncbi:hypothetical protein PIB30_057094 [Stylosanthes scabra]|uniref:Uncharacterized protein n=1 Tax=Stylosanthes scabra TaxID=79078 RepID=A0ABU6VI13_9FABA|nr:hypothetical protein [Stylosanthes scabra]
MTYLYGGCGSGYVSARRQETLTARVAVNCAVTQMWVFVVFNAPFSTAAGDGEDDGGASEVQTGARRRMATAGKWRRHPLSINKSNSNGSNVESPFTVMSDKGTFLPVECISNESLLISQGSNVSLNRNHLSLHQCLS